MFDVTVIPEALATATADVAGIGSALSEANAAAASTTSGVLAAGADEVSTAIASLFSGHAVNYQALSAQLARFHDQFVQALRSSGNAYAAAEAANVSPLASAERSMQSAVASLLSRP